MLNSKENEIGIKEEEMPRRRKKKWGKIGAPYSKKRKDWMKKIRKKRGKPKKGVKRVKPKFPKRKTRKRRTR